MPWWAFLKSAIAVVSARSASLAVQVRYRTRNSSLSCKCHNNLPLRWPTGFPVTTELDQLTQSALETSYACSFADIHDAGTDHPFPFCLNDVQRVVGVVAFEPASDTRN